MPKINTLSTYLRHDQQFDDIDSMVNALESIIEDKVAEINQLKEELAKVRQELEDK